MNIKKIFSAFLLIILFAIFFTPAVLAADLYMVTDIADVLTDEELEDLNKRADEISKKYECDVAIVVVYGLDGDDPYEFNKYVYDEYNFGYGGGENSLIFLLSIEERDYWLEPYGAAISTFKGARLDVMLDDYMLPLLKNDDYYGAFNAYFDKAVEYLEMAKNGEISDIDKVETGSSIQKILFKLAIAILVPLLIAWIVCSIWKGQMKTAVPAKQADQYIPKDGFNLTNKEDKFLYRTTTRRKIETSSSSSRSSSSSGRSGSSGRGGKF